MNGPPSRFAKLLPSHFDLRDSDIELFNRQLRSFVPPNAVDAHAHLLDIAHLDNAVVSGPDTQVTYHSFLSTTQQWMADRAPSSALFFALPSSATLLTPEANHFVREQTRSAPNSTALLTIRPDDDPATVERDALAGGFVGFKVYHLFARHPDTLQAPLDDYLPRWSWEIADRCGLLILLHLVRSRALADEDNLNTLKHRLQDYPNAKLILAHAARGFNAFHTIEAIDQLKSFSNVWFDTAVVCESPPMQVILQRCGSRRLLYGSDHPVSQLRGRYVGLGDGFGMVHQKFDQGEPSILGIESLLALKQTAILERLSDTDIRRIFCENAKELLTSAAARS